MPRMLWTLRYFHHRFSIWIMGQHPLLQADGRWFYPLLEKDIREGGLETIETHRWELTVLHYHKIMVIYPYPFLVVIAQFFS